MIDYIYYRMYAAYKKADENPGFTTPLLFSAIFSLYVSIPLLILGGHYFHISTIVFMLIYIAIGINGFIFTIRRYDKKKITEIFLKYRFHKCNQWIKNWMLYVGIILIFPLGLFTFGLWGIIFKFLGLI